MTLTDILIYFAVPAVGSAINSVAGGGTFIVFPILIMNGMSPLVANIMCTIALWPGSVASAFTYRKQLDTDRKTLLSFGIVSILGSLLGTVVLLAAPETTFEHLVPWLLLFATLLFIFGGKMHIPSLLQGRKAALALQFAIAIYGGYFGAGIGILMLAMLQISGLRDIHRMNALKTILGSIINAVAVVIFAFSGKVVWDVALVMIAGAVAGGHFGTRLALIAPPQKVRFLVSAIAMTVTLYFFLR